MCQCHPQPSRPISKKPRDANQIMAAAVTAKIEEGNLKAAVRILCSDEQPAEPTLETLEKLQKKHPVRSTDRRDAPPLEQLSLSVDKSLVLKAIRSFPNGSSGGSDGFRPGHLKDLISCQETSDRLLDALTDFVNLMLSGCCPAQVQPVFFGGRLIALAKRDAEFAQSQLAWSGGGWSQNVLQPMRQSEQDIYSTRSS